MVSAGIVLNAALETGGRGGGGRAFESLGGPDGSVDADVSGFSACDGFVSKSSDIALNATFATGGGGGRVRELLDGPIVIDDLATCVFKVTADRDSSTSIDLVLEVVLETDGGGGGRAFEILVFEDELNVVGDSDV